MNNAEKCSCGHRRDDHQLGGRRGPGFAICLAATCSCGGFRSVENTEAPCRRCGHVFDIHNPGCGACKCAEFVGEPLAQDARPALIAERDRYRKALEALHHELNLGEAAEGDIPAIESCARIVSMALRGE